ncbi:cytochrome P450 [Crassisporium funariophilum]|nr:cytochrome P450 [Crassisporium funariophilum]
MPPLLIPLLLLLLLLCFLASGFLRLLLRQFRSPLRHLAGPPSPSLFMGNLEEMHDQENTNLIARWVHAYGSTFVYRGFVGGCRLMTTDPVAVAHVLGNAYDYPKPDFVRDSLASMVAGQEGLLTVEGEDHRRQRKILTPAFSAPRVKSLSPIFWDKATQLRDIWLSQLPASDDIGREKSITRVDVLIWLGRATLDVIGLAGFGYTFDALTDDTNELARAFNVIFSTARKFRVITILQAWFPFLRRFRRNNATMIQAQATMRRIGLSLIDEKRKAVEQEALSPKFNASEKEMKGRDLLSVLIRSNMSSEPNQRMSVDEVLCQISTFLTAGHETTSSALSWCLYALSRSPLSQSRLRDALLELEGQVTEERDLTDVVGACTYLDWVVRESLRLHAPVTNTMRVCMRDWDEIPLSQYPSSFSSSSPSSSSSTSAASASVEAGGQGGEGKMGKGRGGAVDRYGRRRASIQVRKWDIISVPIQAINKSEEFWGEDAGVFRPERWAAPPKDARAIPGLYSNTLTFLNGNPLGGNRACIGYKFALVEIKIFLYVLLKDIEFSIDPAMVIEKKVK